MSINEYVQSLTSDQLTHLIEQAQKRLVEIASEGHVVLYGVFGGSKTKWFEIKHDANDYFMQAAKEALTDSYPEVSMEKRRVKLNELAEYLGKEKAKSIIENGSLIVKKDGG